MDKLLQARKQRSCLEAIMPMSPTPCHTCKNPQLQNLDQLGACSQHHKRSTAHRGNEHGVALHPWRRVARDTAAGSVIRDVIPVRGDLEDGARTWVAVVVEVD